VKRVLQSLLALLRVAAGANHFRAPRFWLRMMPVYLPWHGPLVFWTGVAEVLLGVGLVVPQMRPEKLRKLHPARLWLRLPVQGALILWAWRYTCAGSRLPPGGSACPPASPSVASFLDSTGGPL